MDRSPFPGMDPFIEARGLWADFHDKLIVEIANALNASLPPRYTAQLGERTFVDSIDVLGQRSDSVLIKPDVRVDYEGPRADQVPGTALREDLAATSVLLEGPREFEERENFVEIRDLDNQEALVTCIEVLSPSNKRPGTSGWYEYERKRSLFFQGAANFVEIDLLRGGQRHAMKGRWPDSPYCLLVLWKDRVPWSRVWPTYLTQPILPLPIPLLPPDPDLILELQPLIDTIYRGSRYTRRLRYNELIDPPLSPDEAAFLTGPS
ncbi:MAG TPA: DUF4058 family protein [Pirellulaceae bacterium]|nr:DUF4058 family protein [Pirellulaceae bacterium]